MGSNGDLEAVEKIINYHFKSKALLSEALTAAGADSENYDGNRKLAEIGADMIDFWVSLDGRKEQGRGQTMALKQNLRSSNHRALVAQRTTIDKHIRYNTRPGAQQPSVIGKAVVAIIAAIYLDCGSRSITWDIMQHIGFFAQRDDGVNPKLLEYGAASGNPVFMGPLVCQNDGVPHIHTVIESESAITTQPQRPSRAGRETSHSSRSSSASFSGNAVEFEANSTHNSLTGPRKRNTEALGNNETQNHKPSNKRAIRTTNYQVARFIDTETAKCKAAGLPSPEESYFSADTQAQILDLAHDRSIENVRKLLLYMGSSQSVAALQAAIQSWRTQANIESWQLSRSLSKPETYKIIEGINRDIVCLNLIRRYHVLHLFEECGGCETPSSVGYVQFSNSINRTSRNLGNPRNNAEAEVAKAMMNEIFPHLQPGTQEYTEKATAVKSLRQLGRRFHILTTHFGRGILALLPYHDLPGQPDCLGISDNMILRIPDSTFLKVVLILERSQGDIIKNFSAAALRIVNALLHDSRDQSATFYLEMVGRSEILEFPKNSLQLFGLMV